MTDQITPTHLTRASDLDGLHGVYEYEPGDKIKDLARKIKDKMDAEFNITIWQSDLEEMIAQAGLEEVNQDGRFTTRLIKEWKRRNKLDRNQTGFYPYKPVTELAAIAGDLYKQIIKRKPCRVCWRITADINGVMEGTGENSGYGNPHSCWYGYGDFSNSPDILEECNGAGLLIGTGEPVNLKNGVGRIWMVNGTDGIILFNPYLDLNDGVNRNQNDIAEFYADLLLKEVFKYPYETISEWQVKKYLAPNGDPIRVIPVDIEHDPQIYVNYDTGWMITTEKYPDTGEPLGEGGYYCENCGERIRPGDHFTSPDGDILCEDCFWEYYTWCARCEDTISREDAIYHDGEAYCQECYEERFTECEECGEVIYRGDAITDEYGDVYCEECNEWITRMKKLFKEDPDQLWRELAGDRWDEVEAIIKAKQEQKQQPEHELPQISLDEFFRRYPQGSR